MDGIGKDRLDTGSWMPEQGWGGVGKLIRILHRRTKY